MDDDYRKFCMTSEEAIRWLDAIKKYYIHGGDEAYDKKRMKAIDKAIKALDAQPCEDCISREEVQDLISRWLSDYLLDETREALETINYKVGDMPSVTPQRPKGKWIEVLEHRDEFGSTWHYECSECRGRSYKGFEPLERCCPNCGAEMSGGGEDETDN